MPLFGACRMILTAYILFRYMTGKIEMPSDSTPKVVLAASAGGDLCLTAEERDLIRNFRLAKRAAKTMILDLACIYARTLPLEGVKVSLVMRPAG